VLVSAVVAATVAVEGACTTAVLPDPEATGTTPTEAAAMPLVPAADPLPESNSRLSRFKLLFERLRPRFDHLVGDFPTRKIPIAELNLAATLQVNQDRARILVCRPGQAK
jgi:hypothetical protein